MANLKISGLNPETNLSNVLGLAGYNASGTIQISGADIISSVGSAINTLYTSDGTLSGDRVINANNNQCDFNNVRGMKITSNGSPINGVIFDVRNIGGGSILAVGDANDNVLITGGPSINLTFEPSSALEVRSTTQGFLKPVMTGAQVEGISTPATGLEAYATSAGAGDVTGAGWWGYNGSNWVQINGGGSTPNLQAVMTVGSSYQGPNVVKLQTDHASGNQMIEFASNAMYVRDSQNSQGLVYWTDYSANFTTNSLVSKLYVDTRPVPTLSLVLLQNGNNNTNVSSDILIGTASGFDALLEGDNANLNSKDVAGKVELRHVPSANRIEVTNTLINLFGDVDVNNDIQFSNNVIDVNGNAGTNGQVLASQGTGNGVEWTDINPAFSPIDVASSELNTVGATTQYYYQTIAGATMTISKAKVWGFSGTDTVLFGIYRGKFGSLTLIGQGSAVCSIGPNEINLTAEVGQNLQVTAGEDIVVGLYPSGISWTTVYSQGIGDANFAIENTANISTMPATPTGTGTETRFACTLY